MIETFTTGPIATNSYILHDNKSAVIIDCSFESFDQIDRYIKNHELTIEKIFLTHSHWDHIADLSLFKQAYPVDIFVHPFDEPNVHNPGVDRLTCPLKMTGVNDVKNYNDQQKITAGSFEILVLHTPGHSPGSVCLYVEAQNILFSGDTLFAHGIGRLDLPTGNESEMVHSLIKLAKLPKDCIAYPGHGPKETIGNMPFNKHRNS